MTDHTPAAPGPDDEGYWAPVDSSGITQSAGIPEADLAKIVAATASHKSGDDLVRIEMLTITDAVRCGYCDCIGSNIAGVDVAYHSWCSCPHDRAAQWTVCVYSGDLPLADPVPACEQCAGLILNAASVKTVARNPANAAQSALCAEGGDR